MHKPSMVVEPISESLQFTNLYFLYQKNFHFHENQPSRYLENPTRNRSLELEVCFPLSSWLLKPCLFMRMGGEVGAYVMLLITNLRHFAISFSFRYPMLVNFASFCVFCTKMQSKKFPTNDCFLF